MMMHVRCVCALGFPSHSAVPADKAETTRKVFPLFYPFLSFLATPSVALSAVSAGLEFVNTNSIRSRATQASADRLTAHFDQQK